MKRKKREKFNQSTNQRRGIFVKCTDGDDEWKKNTIACQQKCVYVALKNDLVPLIISGFGFSLSIQPASVRRAFSMAMLTAVTSSRLSTQ